MPKERPNQSGKNPPSLRNQSDQKLSKHSTNFIFARISTFKSAPRSFTTYFGTLAKRSLQDRPSKKSIL